ncbi:uncharacterized protein LOC128217418 [Mya arenaria]|uniref:uncharacterized protein LOC128217418 n=1 Tax=Mya arenaria TaxID=6604 RepID=UPI0022E73BB3|nr:uncharacterized protein LOC128217418 [Mya arenaria]
MGSTGSPVVTESIELQESEPGNSSGPHGISQVVKKDRTVFDLLCIAADLLFIPAVLVSFFSNIVMLIDLYTIEKGLVYGPPSSAKKIALTVFIAISFLNGVTQLCIHSVNIWFKHSKKKDLEIIPEGYDLFAAFSSEIPILIVTIVITGCREEELSVSQIIKAIVTLCMYALICCQECCGDKLKKCCADKLKKACGEYDQEQANKEDNQGTKRFRYYISIFTCIGGVIVLICFIVVSVFVFSTRNTDGKILIESTKYDEKILYRDAKYFNNVSIYFSHSDLDYFNSDDIHFSHRNLLPLISLNSLRKRNKTQVVRVAIEKVVNKSRLQLDDGRKHECFIINHQPDGRSVRKEQCSENFIVNLHKEFIFQIKYVISKDRLLLKPKQVFGDIHYNMKVKTRTECTQPDFRVSDNLKDRSSDSTTAVLHYFRSADGVDEDYNVRYIREEQKTFYQAQDLEDSVDIWNTGILHCKSSGNLAPTFDKEILVNC